MTRKKAAEKEFIKFKYRTMGGSISYTINRALFSNTDIARTLRIIAEDAYENGRRYERLVLHEALERHNAIIEGAQKRPK